MLINQSEAFHAANAPSEAVFGIPGAISNRNTQRSSRSANVAHHDIPWCARHGRRHWYNLDLTYLVILIPEATRLIWNVQHADQSDT